MAKKWAGQGGFTLVELLVVIAILGILAGIAVFAVSGAGDKGQSAACKTDEQTLITAEEAYFARNSTYVDGGVLVPTFLASASTMHTAKAIGGGTRYKIDGIAPCP